MEANNETICACNGVCQALANAMIVDKSPDAYVDQRISVLLEWIEAVGIEEALQAIELEAGRKIMIAGKDGMFLATGPGVVFITILPLEAFQGLRRA
ncbi:hypothetical protein [Methanomassiliicoccus luminyensis]|uniref:hypothetical protein n=1 Tax=Methanomassiliicoccus luminyensis TaxID=1080712 RepID=UPI0011CB93E1|nr:hypothetical protein [Methanomassiliicoccus luminyensis]